MKKLFTLFLFSIATNYFAQSPTEQDVIKSNSIVFYGYDFSRFQLSDGKRMGQDLKKYVFNLLGEFQEHIPEKKLKKWMSKDSIAFNFMPTMMINKKTSNDDIASPVKNTIPKDSLQTMINRYPVTEKSGIGYVIIFECFDMSSKSVSAYSAFFDIATKKIISTEYASKHDNNSFNRISDWNPVAVATVRKLLDLYSTKIPKDK